MPVIIVRYIATRTNSRFHKIYFLFAAFILACGFTHLLDAITFWYPVYRFNALVRFITGIISWATVYQLIKILPFAFSLKTAGELEVEVEQRKLIEEDLKVKIRLLNEAQEIAKMGHWEWDAATNTFTVSDNLFRIYELKPRVETLSYNDFLASVHADDRHTLSTLMQQAVTDKQFNELFYRIPSPDGTNKTIHMKGEVITGDNFEIHKVVGTSQDVTLQKRTEQELQVKSNQLESKNTELQRFAYVASHDLQEPLRKIRTFISRIDYNGDDASDKNRAYIEKINHSAARMQSLIEDILNFSKVSEDKSLFGQTDLNDVVSAVLGDMEIIIESSKAKILTAKLPVISANASQLGQLFQNLIGNAIKFRTQDVQPRIIIESAILTGADISAPEWIKSHYKFSGWEESRYWANEKFCRITVTDNGIGFEQEYADRIFEAFQRLSKNYEGTGIGLAICKKIADNHHGIIAVSSVAAKGTTFSVTLPVSQNNFE